MTAVSGAILFLAGAVLVSMGALVDAVYLTSAKSNIITNVDGVLLMLGGGIALLVGLITFIRGLSANRRM